MDSIVVIGGGGHAKVLTSVLRKIPYEIVGYTDNQDRGTILGVQYLGDDEALAELLRAHSCLSAAVGMGKIDVSARRLVLEAAIRALGFDFPVVLSPQAVVNEEVELGPGTTVFDGAVVNSGTVAGRLCILNTNSTVEHDCRLGDNVHVGPGATISGGAVIGANCVIGAGSTVIQEIAICHSCLIGAGSTVVHDVTTPGTWAGSPARRLR